MMKKILMILFVITLFVSSGCVFDKKPKHMVGDIDGYKITKENDASKNKELKLSWQALDVAYVEYEPVRRLGAKNILTISEYNKEDYSSWLNTYYDDKVVMYKGDNIPINCEFETLQGIPTQVCQPSIPLVDDYGIYKLTFGLQQRFLIRVLCIDANPDLAKQHCSDIMANVVKRAG